MVTTANATTKRVERQSSLVTEKGDIHRNMECQNATANRSTSHVNTRVGKIQMERYRRL